ncbi:hypothetical protein [Intestinibacillus sp. Marseille-P6563]|uniref:hypothetical protein n=1 Tax=Intestinibacillus sp. Marseille-P6563 TaxID=2364792 RepID=UPI000F06B3DA|nr:hypothetical protein [Intestinibacillus sp. Marseille-P6563]
MQQDSDRPSRGIFWAKVTGGYAIFTMVLQVTTYLAGAGSPAYFGGIHLAATLVFLVASLWRTFYALHTGNRTILFLDSIYWIASLLLTLPAFLAAFGLMAQNSNLFYQWILFPVVSQFFGFLPWMNEMSVLGLVVAFACLQLGILYCGAYRRKLIR